jgi:hypothetical protein
MFDETGYVSCFFWVVGDIHPSFWVGWQIRIHCVQVEIRQTDDLRTRINDF